MTANPQPSCDGKSFEESRRTLTVEFEIEFDSETDSCPIVVDCDASAPLKHHLIDDTCYVSCPSSKDGTAVRQRQVPVDRECICRIVASYDCNPSLQSAGDGRLVVRTHPPDRGTLRALIEELRAAVGEVRIRSLVIDSEESTLQSRLVSLQGLTATERETVELAILEGYYDRPREIPFEDLATELGVTKSALSKRLGSAEAKIMRDLFQNVG